MKKFGLFILIFITICASSFNAKRVCASSYQPDSIGNYYFDYESNLSSSYYDGLDELEGDEFKNRLHMIISANTKKYSYDECYSLLETLDEDPNNSSNILCLLTRKSMPKNMHGSSTSYYWNREHIWAKAHGFNGQIDSRPWNDLNHLRAVEGYTNSTYHNDRNYAYVLDGIMREDANGNKYNSLYYEPRDGAKGDIARMLLYMTIRYTGDELSDGYNLSLSNDKELINKASSVSEKSGSVGLLDTILEWCFLDPVDDLERKRNDLVFSLQGNRNPFIDHPEYVNKLYATKYNIQQENEYRVYYYVNNATFNYFDANNYKDGDLVLEPTNNPVCNDKNYEFEGWYLDQDFTQKFDFKTPIKNNLKLYANFKKIDKDPLELLKETNILVKLKYAYLEKEESCNPIYEQLAIIPSQNEGGSFNAKKNTEKSFDDLLDYDKNLFKVLYYTNNKASSYCGKGFLKLYAGGGNGTEIVITALDNKITITDINYIGKNETTKANITDEQLKTTYLNDNKAVSLRNIINQTKGNALAISEITITFFRNDLNLDYTFSNAKMMFGIVISNDDYLNLPRLSFTLNGNLVEYMVYDYDENNKILMIETSVSDFNLKYRIAIASFDNDLSLEKEVTFKDIALKYLKNYSSDYAVNMHLDSLLHLAY